jgi:hypothetical protein
MRQTKSGGANRRLLSGAPLLGVVHSRQGAALGAFSLATRDSPSELSFSVDAVADTEEVKWSFANIHREAHLRLISRPER